MTPNRGILRDWQGRFDVWATYEPNLDRISDAAVLESADSFLFPSIDPPAEIRNLVVRTLSPKEWSLIEQKYECIRGELRLPFEDVAWNIPVLCKNIDTHNGPIEKSRVCLVDSVVGIPGLSLTLFKGLRMHVRFRPCDALPAETCIPIPTEL